MYTIEVTYNGPAEAVWTDSVDYYYRGDTFLPLVSSKSIKYDFDQDDFYFYWTIPAKDVFKMDHTLFNSSATYPQIRAMMERYNNNGDRYSYWTEMPYLSTGVYVPADSGIFDDPELIDRIEIGVQFRIRENSSRTVSKWKTIRLPK